MELNDIPLKYEDVQTAKQQSLAITHCYFKQPMKQFYNNSIYKIQTHNYGLLNLHGMILLAHTIAVLTIFSIWYFGSETYKSLAAHQYPTTAHPKFLSRQMQNDLANFAKSGKMPWPMYHNERRYYHINNVIASKKHT